MSSQQSAIVYVDGFNLYHGALARRPACKWLDLWSLGAHLIPTGASLQRVYFFTARIDDRGVDPSQPQRQDAYWRALAFRRDQVVIKKGNFKTREKRLPLAAPTGGQKFANVMVTEEKGSDVNLATQLLVDAAVDAADIAVVVSDDFDLEEPLRVARRRLGRVVGVVSPRDRRWLANRVPAHFYKPLKERWLLASQFPDQVVVDGRTIHRPTTWA